MEDRSSSGWLRTMIAKELASGEGAGDRMEAGCQVMISEDEDMVFDGGFEFVTNSGARRTGN